MKYAHQFLVTRVSLIAIGAMLTVPLPAEAGEIHGQLGGGYNDSVSLGPDTLGTTSPGVSNTAIGSGALKTNSSGSQNTAVGSSALISNSSGLNNTAVGAHVLMKNKGGSGIGHENTGIGTYALEQNTKGSGNTAGGVGALMNNKSGSENVALGHGALWATEKGNDNTAIGRSAGGKNKTGSRNVFIGKGAGNNVGYTNKSDQLVIANGPLPPNQLMIGDFSKRTLLINGKTSINGDAMVRGNLKVQGKAFAASFEKSDSRLKKDIKPLTHALDSILQLQAKTYRWKEDTTFANKADIGLVAQDVEKVFPELVAEDEQGYKGIAYSKLTAVLIEAIKEQQEAFTRDVADLGDAITVLETENAQLKAMMSNDIEALLARVAALEGIPLAQH